MRKIRTFLRGFYWGYKFSDDVKRIERLSKHYTIVPIGRDSLPIHSYLKRRGVKSYFLPVSTPAISWALERADIKKALKIGKETTSEEYRKLFKTIQRINRISRISKKPLLFVDMGAIKGTHLLNLGTLAKELKIRFGIAAPRVPDLFDPNLYGDIDSLKPWKKHFTGNIPAEEIYKYENSVPKFIGHYIEPGKPESIRKGKYKEYKTYMRGFMLGTKLSGFRRVIKNINRFVNKRIKMPR